MANYLHSTNVQMQCSVSDIKSDSNNLAEKENMSRENKMRLFQVAPYLTINKQILQTSVETAWSKEAVAVGIF